MFSTLYAQWTNHRAEGPSLPFHQRFVKANNNNLGKSKKKNDVKVWNCPHVAECGIRLEKLWEGRWMEVKRLELQKLEGGGPTGVEWDSQQQCAWPKPSLVLVSKAPKNLSFKVSLHCGTIFEVFFLFVCFYQSFNKCSKWDYSSSIIWFLTKSRLEQWSGPFLDICGQVHMTPHRIALCPFYIQHTHHGSCFLMGCKFPPTSSNILPSTAQTWMPWWYVSTRHYAACVYAACRPTSSAQVVPGDKLLSWRAGEATQALQGPFCSWIC